MELEQAIRGRRSIRKYQDKEVPLELVLKAVELASWAPNNGNFQAWQFVVVRDRDMINRIADVVQAKVDMIAAWPEAEDFRETMNRHQAKAAFFRHAPILIAVGMGGYQGPADKVLRLREQCDDCDCQEMIKNRKEIASRAQTVAAATMLLELACHSLGLGSCWLAGPMLARREITEMLGVAEGVQLFNLVSVGWPAEERVGGPRRPLEELVKVI